MEESVLTWMKLDTLRSCCRDHSCQQGQVNKAGDERKKVRERLIWPQQEVPSDEKDYFTLLISSTSSANILITVLASCCRNKYSDGGRIAYLFVSILSAQKQTEDCSSSFTGKVRYQCRTMGYIYILLLITGAAPQPDIAQLHQNERRKVGTD